jgi:hypothetical protein
MCIRPPRRRALWLLQARLRMLGSWGGSRAEVSLDLVSPVLSCYILTVIVGHGPLSSTYGLGVDNVLEIEIVTPNGVLQTANRCTNPDLFWALRGGGGGTFGVITSVTMKAYPSPQNSMHTFTLTQTNPNNLTGYWDIIASVVSEIPRLNQAGMQGYSTFTPPGIDGAETWKWSWRFNLYEKPNGTIEALFAPIAEKLDRETGMTIVYTSKVTHYPSFFASWNATVGFETVASVGAALGSHLLPAVSLI